MPPTFLHLRTPPLAQAMVPGHPYLVWPPRAGLTSLNTKQLSKFFSLLCVCHNSPWLSVFQWVPLALPNPPHGSLPLLTPPFPFCSLGFSVHPFFHCIHPKLLQCNSPGELPFVRIKPARPFLKLKKQISKNQNPSGLAYESIHFHPNPPFLWSPLSALGALYKLFRMWLILIPAHAAGSPFMSIPLCLLKDVLSSSLRTP